MTTGLWPSAELAKQTGQDSLTPVLKKITVVESNNLFFTDRYQYLHLPKSPTDPEMKKLHDYVQKSVQVKGIADPELFKVLMEWVCLQWEHDALHEPPPGSSSLSMLQSAARGERYRCQEYAQVLHDVLTSFGYVSRLLQLRRSDAAYGSPGAGHVAVEVYSNSLAKWIFLDPQWCVSAYSTAGTLNFHEMFLMKKAGTFDSLRFSTSPRVLARDSVPSEQEYCQMYRDFIQLYFGYEGFVVKRFGGLVFLFLPLEAHEQNLSFQGVPVNRRVFTDKESNLYFNTNSTVVLFDYGKEVNWSEIFRNYEIKTPEDYVHNMPRFAATPNFLLHFENNCLWFDHYEIKIGSGEWKRIKSHSYYWNLSEGTNEFRIRAVNVAGVAGKETYTKIHYGSSLSTR